MDKRLIYIVLAITALIILIGAVYVYFNSHGDYSADIQIEGGDVSFTVSGIDAELSYAMYSGTSLPDHIYLYFDERYKSNLNDNYQQKSFFDVLKNMLERRNYSKVTYCNADELKTIMTSDEKCAIFFVSGALPDTVYTENENIFQEWMEKTHGTIYWAGPEIGRYISTTNGVSDMRTGFFNGRVAETKQYAYKQSLMFEGTQLRYDVCDYGISLSVENSLPLGYVNEEYSAVTAVKLFNGNAIVYGGNIAKSEVISHELLDRTSCADLIVSGLTYDSSVLYSGKGKVSDGKIFVGNKAAYDNVLLFIGVGSPTTSWSIGKQLS